MVSISEQAKKEFSMCDTFPEDLISQQEFKGIMEKSKIPQNQWDEYFVPEHLGQDTQYRPTPKGEILLQSM